MFTIEGFHCSSFDEMCTAVALTMVWILHGIASMLGPLHDFVDRDKQCLVPKLQTTEVCRLVVHRRGQMGSGSQELN